jgi:hypothetical protein
VMSPAKAPAGVFNPMMSPAKAPAGVPTPVMSPAKAPAGVFNPMMSPAKTPIGVSKPVAQSPSDARVVFLENVPVLTDVINDASVFEAISMQFVILTSDIYSVKKISSWAVGPGYGLAQCALFVSKEAFKVLDHLEPVSFVSEDFHELVVISERRFIAYLKLVDDPTPMVAQSLLNASGDLFDYFEVNALDPVIKLIFPDESKRRTFISQCLEIHSSPLDTL